MATRTRSTAGYLVSFLVTVILGADKPPHYAFDAEPGLEAGLPPGAVARLGVCRLQCDADYDFHVSPDDTLVLLKPTLWDSRVAVCDLRTGNKLYSLGEAVAKTSFNNRMTPRHLGFSPTGSLLAILDNGSIKLVSASTGRISHVLDANVTAEIVDSRFGVGREVFGAVYGDGTIRVWNTGNGRLTASLRVREVRDILLSPDLLSCAYTTDGYDVHLVDVTTGKERVAVRKGFSKIGRFVFSIHGKTLLTVDSKGRRVGRWDITTGNQSEFQLEPPVDLGLMVVSEDSRVLAGVRYSDRGTPETWDLESGRSLAVIRVMKKPVDTSAIKGLAIAADGKRLAVVTEKLITVYDTHSGHAMYEKRVCGSRKCTVQFAKNGQFVAIQDDTAIRLLDACSGEESWSGGGHINEIHRLRFSHNKRALASAGVDGTIRIWDVQTGRQRACLQLEYGIVSEMEVDRNGDMVIFITNTGDRKVFLWKTTQAGPETLCMYGVGMSGLLRNGLGILGLLGNYSATKLAMSANGEGVAIGGSGEDSIEVWNTLTRKRVTHLRGWSVVCVLALDSKGNTVALEGAPPSINEEDGMPALYFVDVRTGKVTRVLDMVTGQLQVSSDGRLICAICGSTCKVWELATRRLVLESNTNEMREIWSVCVTCTGEAVLVESGDEDRLSYYVVRVGKNKLDRIPVPSNDKAVSSVAISGDGHVIATGSMSGQLLLWDVNTLTGQKVGEQVAIGEKESAALWTILGDGDPKRAFRSVRDLVRGQQSSVALLKSRITFEKREDIEPLVKRLDDPSFGSREVATQRLAELSFHAEGALRNALEKAASPESRRRIEELLIRLESIPLPKEAVRELRAITVLEQIGSSAAREVLRAVACGNPGCLRTREAKSALDRLSER